MSLIAGIEINSKSYENNMQRLSFFSFYCGHVIHKNEHKMLILKKKKTK